MAVRVEEESPKSLVLILAPPPKPGGELSDEQLEAVAGGWDIWQSITNAARAVAQAANTVQNTWAYLVSHPITITIKIH